MFQRLVAIPQEEYAQLTAVQQARQPITQQFYDLENKYRQDENIRDSYKRLALQSETLDEMKRLKQKMREDIEISTPKIYQSRARMLYQSTEPFIKFNERGEIYDEHGTLIENSRLEDLVQYAIRDRRRDILPVGWKAFVNVLRNNNVPKYVLNRYTVDELNNPVIKEEVSVSSSTRKRKLSPDSDIAKKVKSFPSSTRKRKHSPDSDITKKVNVSKPKRKIKQVKRRTTATSSSKDLRKSEDVKNIFHELRSTNTTRRSPAKRKTYNDFIYYH